MKKLRIHFCLEFFFSIWDDGEVPSSFVMQTFYLIYIFWSLSLAIAPTQSPPPPTPFLLETKRFCWGGKFHFCSNFPRYLVPHACLNRPTRFLLLFVVSSYKTCNYCSIPSRWYPPTPLPALLDDTLGHDRWVVEASKFRRYFVFSSHYPIFRPYVWVSSSDHMFGWVAFSAAPWEKKKNRKKIK